MIIGSLCTGYGGLDRAAAEYYGGRIAWVSDIDRGANTILAGRLPDVPNLGDITAIDWRRVEPVDAVVAGTPCQDLSHAGKRRGMRHGTRSNLWVAMREAIATIRPRLVIWENVYGALSAAADSDLGPCPRCMDDPRDREPVLRALGRVLGDLTELGFDADWATVRASDVGAPHQRARVFLIAYPASLGYERVDTARRRRTGSAESAADAARARRSRRVRPEPLEALLPTPTAGDADSSGSRNLPGSNAHTGVSLTDAVLFGDSTTPRLTIEVRESFRAYAPAVAHWERLTRPAPPPTVPSGRNGAPRLNPAFSEWMMGLPAGYVTDPTLWVGWPPVTSRNAQLRVLGNGVVPQQALAALDILNDLGGLS